MVVPSERWTALVIKLKREKEIRVQKHLVKC